MSKNNNESDTFVLIRVKLLIEDKKHLLILDILCIFPSCKQENLN